MTDTTHDDLVRSKAARKLNEVHRQVCFENGDHALEVDTPYSLGADALQRIAELEAKLAKAVGALTKIADRSSEMVWGEGGEILEAMYDMESIAEVTLADLERLWRGAR
jgi:hypothetical protein